MENFKNEKETKALAEFRVATAELYGDSTPGDHFLIRWLRARNLDIEKAKLMLQKYLEWRAENPDLKLITGGNWIAPKFVSDRIKIKITGHDYQGRPIIWSDAGRFLLNEIIDGGFKDDIFRLGYQLMDQFILPEVERMRVEKNISQFIFILDTSAMTLRRALHFQSAQTRVKFVREFEAYYPEVLHSSYIINAHWVIMNIFSILRPFISSNTQSKINLFGTNEEEWKAALLEKFPSDAIPEDYGGTGSSFAAIYQ